MCTAVTKFVRVLFGDWSGTGHLSRQVYCDMCHSNLKHPLQLVLAAAECVRGYYGDGTTCTVCPEGKTTVESGPNAVAADCSGEYAGYGVDWVWGLCFCNYC